MLRLGLYDFETNESARRGFTIHNPTITITCVCKISFNPRSLWEGCFYFRNNYVGQDH